MMDRVTIIDENPIAHGSIGHLKGEYPSGLLKAFEDCIQGHESLHKAGILHRDIH